MTPLDLSALRPGDILLYRPKGIIGWLIASRTWSNWAHVEVYAGGGQTLASRNLIGVGRYEVWTDRVGKVLRPRETPLWARGMAWFDGVANGQKYDLWAIARFLLPHWITRDVDVDRQICSAFAVRFLRHCGVDVVAADADADLIAPSDIAKSAVCDVVWSDGKP